MKWSRLVQGIEPSAVPAQADPEITSVTSDSRQVREGALFVAIPGAAGDGHRYVGEALRRGAAAVVTEREIALPPGVASARVSSSREALGRLAAALHAFPTRRLFTAGVTGTSGKTTVSYLIRHVLLEAGQPAGLLGTVQYDLVGRQVESDRTTPDAARLQGYFSEMVKSGARAAVMEVSSHSLDQDRARGVDFDAAVFTNLTPEHLDYHGDMESYFRAKKKLFDLLLPESQKGKKWSAVNADDPYGRRLFAEISGTKMSYGFSPDADFRASDPKMDFRGTVFTMTSPFGGGTIRTNLIGRHNVMNLLAAAAAVAPLGLGWGNFARAVEKVSVPGRLEPLFTEKGSAVFVDYAHCHDALEKAIAALRPLTRGKLWVVFGCGGDRDRGKREKMGRVAGRLADGVVVTSDNPRSEDPQAIIEEILRGLSGCRAAVETEPDREKAIGLALARAGRGDVVLIAGKGHEKEQIFRDKIIPFDDKKVAEFYGRAVV